MILDRNTLYVFILKAFKVSILSCTQGVKPASHAGNPGSNPGGITTWRIKAFSISGSLFLLDDLFIPQESWKNKKTKG